MKSKELKVYNLPSNFTSSLVIDAKPHLFLICAIVFGIMLCFYPPSLPYGVFLICVNACFLLFMPRTIMIEYYDAYMVLHNKANKSDCVLIYYDDVTSWYYSWSGYVDYLYIELEDGTVEKIEAFSRKKFERSMNIYLKDKKKKVNK